MARALKIAVGVVVLCVLAGIWWWMSSIPSNVEKTVSASMDEPTSTHAVPSPVSEPNVSTPGIKPTEATAATDTPTPADEKIESARQSMSTSLSQGDARTPELAPQFEREKPSADVLADPALYEEYELGQTKKIATIYLSMLGQIPILRARIDAAKASGSKTAEEIAEAEEALAKLEELKREIEQNHPDMLPANETSEQSSEPHSPE